MTAAARLEAYVRRFYRRSGGQFPTVRRAARAIGVSQVDIEEAAADLPLMLTEYNVVPADPLGDHFIEICE